MSTPQRELGFREEHGGFSLVLKRNCSISPAGLACAFAALAAVALAIGIGFAAVGAWPILPFAGLEVLLLGGAFLLHARHAADYERIELHEGRLRVEVAEARRRASYEMEARGVRVGMRGPSLMLQGPGGQFELGRHLDAGSRVVFASELKRRLGDRTR